MLEELVQEIENKLSENSGVMLYQALLDSTDYPKRSTLPNALKRGKELGKFKRVLRFDTEARQNILTIETIVSGGE